MTRQSPDVVSVKPRGPLVGGWSAMLQAHAWLPFVLPFAVFMVTGLIEPPVPPSAVPASPSVASESETATASGNDGDTAASWLSYPAAYVVRVVLTLVSILLVLPAWRAIPLRVSWLAAPVGLLGGVLWVLVCRMKLEDQFLTLIGCSQWATWGDRPAFNPYDYFGEGIWLMVAFLAIRFTALTLLVPLLEEFFLRGFLMRFLQKADWWTIPLGVVTWGSGLMVVAYAVLSHPAEPIAAALWFTLITGLYAWTRSLWDCVVAHGVTNGVMGVYILLWRDWTLW